MTKHLLCWATALGVAAAFTSCAYDPYYYGPNGGYASYGYGEGYGYGGSNFSTSIFVTTGDPRWGYDPYCYSYYDYYRHCYYDPYLYGYYPIGYRPLVVVGVPHPYGYRPGSYCPPPHTIRNVAVVNYRNREIAYRNSGYAWAGHVRVAPAYATQARHPGHYAQPGTFNRPPGTFNRAYSEPRQAAESHSSAYPRSSSRNVPGPYDYRQQPQRNYQNPSHGLQYPSQQSNPTIRSYRQAQPHYQPEGRQQLTPGTSPDPRRSNAQPQRAPSSAERNPGRNHSPDDKAKAMRSLGEG